MTSASNAIAAPEPKGQYFSLKLLLWLYFFLLIFEGSIRKWILPSLSAPLLIVRDPVVILIYLVALRYRLFPTHPFVIWVSVLSLLFVAAAFVAETPRLFVPIFGWRTNFLHLPLIFVIPKVFFPKDVRRMGLVILLLAIPMAMLMVAQFKAPRDSWLNTAAGGKGTQMTVGRDKVRTPGTFSFVQGPASFFALVLAFLLDRQVAKSKTSLWLVIPAAVSLMVAVAVSGSRGLLLAVALTFLFGMSAIFLHPPTLARCGRIAAVSVIAFFGAQLFDVFREGRDVLSERFVSAGTQTGNRVLDFINRYTESLEFPIVGVPIFGHGLGAGTNAGAAMMGGTGFLLAENEWARVVLESGPILGPTYLLTRVGLFFYLCFLSMNQARKGNLLPAFLLGACGVNLINGQFGPPTNLGFVVLIAGLSLASMRVEETVPVREAKLVDPPAARPALSGTNVPARRGPPRRRRFQPLRRPGQHAIRGESSGVS